MTLEVVPGVLFLRALVRKVGPKDEMAAFELTIVEVTQVVPEGELFPRDGGRKWTTTRPSCASTGPFKDGSMGARAGSVDYAGFY